MLNSLQYHLLGVSRQGKVIKLSHSSLAKAEEEEEGGVLRLCPPSPVSSKGAFLEGFSPFVFFKVVALMETFASWQKEILEPLLHHGR